MSFNQSLHIVGNVGREPELRYMPSGAALCQFSVAVDESYKNRDGEKVEKTVWLEVKAWRQLAENVAESITAGTRVVVTGKLDQERWETEGGDKRSKIVMVADEIAPSLRWATASVTKAERWQQEQTG